MNQTDTNTDSDIEEALVDEVAEAICNAGRAVWDDPNSAVKYTTKPSYKDLTLNTKEYYQAMARAAIQTVSQRRV